MNIHKNIASDEEVLGSDASDGMSESPMSAAETAVNAAISDLKKKDPSTKLFRAFIAYNGFYVIRQQTLKDVREVGELTEKKRREAMTQLAGLKDEGERAEFIRKMNEEISDISNVENLKRTVLYPASFASDIDNEKVSPGTLATLVSFVMSVSGWSEDVVITEV